MKKVLAVAALLGLAGAAQAEVTLYGLIDMSYGKNEIAFPGQKEDFFSGGDNGGAGGNQGNSTSKFGLKGSTNVAPGIKANFRLESSGIKSNGSIANDANGDGFFGRQAWAGFSGSFGEVRLGRQDDVIFQTVIGYDANGAANAASAWGNAGTGILGVGRQSRSLQYISPVVADFKLQVSLQPKGNTPGAKDTVGAALTYVAGPMSVSVAAQSQTTEKNDDRGLIIGSYDMGFAKIALGYSYAGYVSSTTAPNGGKPNSGYAYGPSFGISAPVAGFNVGLQMSQNNADNGSMATEFFVNKEIFKGTYGYLDIGSADKLGKANGMGTETRNAFAVGVIYTF